MGYVAVRGGEEAISAAQRLLDVVRAAGLCPTAAASCSESGEGSQGALPLDVAALPHQLHFLHGQVMSEGGLYDDELASLAIKQAMGDPLEAAFYLRAFRCTRPRLLTTPPLETDRMRCIRRISSAFKEVPGGQMLGPTPDYTRRLFRFELLDESPGALAAALVRWLAEHAGDPTRTELGEQVAATEEFPNVVDRLRATGLAPHAMYGPGARDSEGGPSADPEPHDITREPVAAPFPRSASLAIMSRGHTGSMLGLAYSTMRGYGDTHPTIAELRVGYVPVRAPHPVTGEPIEIGEVLMTECQIVAQYTDEPAAEGDGAAPLGAGDERTIDRETRLALGYGACVGHNEVKAICMALLDRSIENGRAKEHPHPAEDAEFVLYHIDGVDSVGFTLHWKLPHYVTFQSDLDRLRATRDAADAAKQGTPNESKPLATHHAGRRRTEAEPGHGAAQEATR